MHNAKRDKSVPWIEQIAQFVAKKSWVVFIATLAILVVGTWGMKDVQVSTNYRAFFGPGNADLKAFEVFEDTFTRNDNFLFALQAEGESRISRQTLEAVKELTHKAWHIPFAIRVDSVTNFQNSYADGDDLTVEDLFPSPADMSDAALEAALMTAQKEPLLNGKLIAIDTATVGVNVTLQYSGDSLEEVTDATAAARALKAKVEADYPGVKVALSGVSALNNAFAESTIADAVTLFPAMFVVLIVVIWLSVRSASGTFAALAVVTLSTVAAMGFAGYASIAISPFSGSAPVVILTLALADCMHIFVSVKALRRKGVDKESAIIAAYNENFIPVTVTSLTTIVGFLALNFSDAPPFNDLGNIVAVGIFFAWMLSLSFFPALLSALPSREPKQGLVDKLIEKKLSAISGLVAARYKETIILGVVLIAASAAMIPQIELNDPWVDYFDEKVEFREDTEFVMDNMTGLYLVEFSVPGTGPGDVNHPAYLSTLEAFSKWLRAREDVSHVQSYTDIIKRINKNMHGDDETYYLIPESREEASQYLLLYELSLPYGLDMNDRINIDRSASRLTVTLPEISTAGVRSFVEQSQAWMAKNAPSATQPVVTGAPVLFARISERNINDMFFGNVVAVLLIAGIISVTLRSVGFGFLSLLPNIVPIIATFGLWSVLVGEVGMAAATVSATSLGIIVDNTVHLLIKFRFARSKHGKSGKEAVQYALDTVGHAVIVNTIILVAGFGVLALSTFRVTGQMGSLTALVIAVAFVVDLILLPAVLLYLANRNEKPTMKGENNAV
jgi:predicted RND superfamily exporter protein